MSAKVKSKKAESYRSDEEQPRIVGVDAVSERLQERDEVAENMNVRAAIIHMIGDII